MAQQALGMRRLVRQTNPNDRYSAAVSFPQNHPLVPQPRLYLAPLHRHSNRWLPIHRRRRHTHASHWRLPHMLLLRQCTMVAPP